ncbi:ATP-binding protein [Campylobacter sp.]|uniref:ATP-binding protein n=1 Tax=Campylobacter sp. TaxID=205 RepID=UPI002710223B|nr:ATP-binding protein [Campylobacter sp.]
MKTDVFYGYNFKIYLTIILFSLFVVLIGVNIYTSSKHYIVELSNKNKITTSNNIVEIFQFWLDERINSLVKASKYIENANILQSEEKIKKFTEIFLEDSNEFDLIQLLKEDSQIYINGEKIVRSKEEQKTRFDLIWYMDTKFEGKPTVNFMPKHAILNEGTLNLCVPNYKDGKFQAVLCGIVKVQNIFEKIGNFKLPPNSYSFIVTHGGEILTQMQDKELKERIESRFKEIFLTDEDISSIVLDSNFISIAEIPSLNWFIGAGTDNAKETKELLEATTKNALVLLFAFVALAFVANSLHSFMYKKVKKKRDEYEMILAHKARMSEAGELISGINHQFIQPVNSLNLMISAILMLKKEGRLDWNMLQNMLEKGQKSISLLSDTIEIFRNFYKTSENIKEFSVNQSIKNLLTLMHTELSRANVYVVLVEFEDKKVNQIENIIQQILLILIHNAKDALADKFKDDIKARKTQIEVNFDDKKCYIRVIEFGSGVSEAISKKIFAEPKTTKKQGSGIGLYFAKKLANKKINGDIRLVNRALPTIFELSFDINLKGDK